MEINTEDKTEKNLKSSSLESSEINWQQYFSSFQIAKPNLAVSPEFKNFQSALWPAANDYPSAVPSLFLSQMMNIKYLQQTKTWIVRDGLIPLLWFFFQNPNPPSFEVRLYVQKNLRTYVPENWREKVGFFDYQSFVSQQTFTQGENNKAFIYSIFMETYVSATGIDFHLEKLTQNLKAKNIKEVLLYIPCRGWSGSKNYLDQHYHATIFQKFYKAISPPIRIMTYEDVKKIESQKINYFYDLNDHLVLADNALTHQIFEAGALPLDSDCDLSVQPNRIVRCSMTYGFKLFDFIVEPSVFPTNEVSNTQQTLSAHKKIVEAAKSEAAKEFPWPKLFTQWSLAQKEHALKVRV